MDIASIVGLIAALFFLSLGITDIGALIDPQSLYLVLGATSAIMLYRSKLSDFLSLGSMMLRVFMNKTEEPDVLIDVLVEIAQIARKDGNVALESVEVSNRYMKKGVTGLVDGTNELLLERAMQRETKLLQGRHENGADMLAAGAELAPGMGMIGTLIGLVNLLANLDDPSTIGPNMAIALLTTLYGSVLANVFFIPMGMKLEGYTKREVNNNELILAGIMFVKAGKNPRLLPEFLGAYTLPKEQRKREAEAAE